MLTYSVLNFEARKREVPSTENIFCCTRVRIRLCKVTGRYKVIEVFQKNIVVSLGDLDEQSWNFYFLSSHIHFIVRSVRIKSLRCLFTFDAWKLSREISVKRISIRVLLKIKIHSISTNWEPCWIEIYEQKDLQCVLFAN